MDTALITEVYMQRPVSLMCLTLGQWFSKALKLGDSNLEHTDTRNAKLMILEKGYHTVPDLLKQLKEFNNGNPSY